MVSPTGIVIMPDSKLWTSRYQLRLVNGRLLHGTWDVTRRLDSARYEAAAVSDALGVPVIPLISMDGPPIPAGELVVDGLLIVPADRLCVVLRDLNRTRGHRRGADPAALADRAEHLLPPYTRRHR